MTVFVIIKGHVKLVHGGSTALRWPAQKGCVTLDGTVNDSKGSAPACG